MPHTTFSDRVFNRRAMKTCHTWRRLSVYAFQGRWWHPTPDIVRSCMLPKGHAACQDQLFLTVCAGQKRWWHATPNVIRPYVLSKRDDSIPSPMSSDCVCFPSAMIACHARRHSTVCAAQGGWWNATPDVVRSYVLSKGDDNVPRPTSSGRVYCLRAMMICHTLSCLTIFVV